MPRPRAATSASGSATSSASSAAAMFQPLFEAPIDVIGDIHGKCGTLRELLDRSSPVSLTLPHSSSVSALIFPNANTPLPLLLIGHGVVHSGEPRAEHHAVLVRELNIMTSLSLNGWYYSESEVIRKDKGATSFQIHAPDDAFRSEVRIGAEGRGEVVRGKAGRGVGA